MKSVSGEEEIVKALKKFSKEVQTKAIVFGTREAAKKIRDDARVYAPLETGNLRENIRALKTPKKITRMLFGTEAVSYTVGVTKLAWYGVFLEYGTKHMSPDPFIYPAVVKNYDNIISILKKNIKVFLDKKV